MPGETKRHSRSSRTRSSSGLPSSLYSSSGLPENPRARNKKTKAREIQDIYIWLFSEDFVFRGECLGASAPNGDSHSFQLERNSHCQSSQESSQINGICQKKSEIRENDTEAEDYLNGKH